MELISPPSPEDEKEEVLSDVQNDEGETDKKQADDPTDDTSLPELVYIMIGADVEKVLEAMGPSEPPTMMEAATSPVHVFQIPLEK